VKLRLQQRDNRPEACVDAAAADGAGGVDPRPGMRWAMAAFYMIAGVAHLTLSDKFLRIVPGWVPFPQAVVLLTGACEIAGSGALADRRLRRLAGVMLALYAVCVFPANVKHAIDDLRRPAGPVNRWYHGPRLALQPVLVWWALFCTGVIDWPARRVCNPIGWRAHLRTRRGRVPRQLARS